MKATRLLPTVVVLPSLVLAASGVAAARVINDSPMGLTQHTATKGTIVTPYITASIGQPSYKPGDTMTLTVTENVWAKRRTFALTDSTGRDWRQTSDNGQTVTFKTTAPNVSGSVIVVMTRTFDGATAKASASYTVVAPPPPPPPPPAPTAQWAGQVPGKFYLGMSCGTVCSDKETQLGQAYGVHRQFEIWGDWSGVAKKAAADHAAGRLPWISIKPPVNGVTGWQQVADGSVDADIVALANALKSVDDQPILLTFNHEPSNDGAESDGVVWAAAYCHLHDLLKAQGALANVADPPILGDWLWNPANRQQDPSNWVTHGVLERAPFLGVDLYENSSGETTAVRIPRILDWMAAQGYPDKMVGIGELGATDAYTVTTATQWLNTSLSWIAAHPDKVGVVSYFNSTVNSRSGVYWPLDESTGKLTAFRTWLNNSAVIS